MSQKASVLDMLLCSDLPDMRASLPEKQVEVSRLSQLTEEPIEFTLRFLTYDQVCCIQGKPVRSRPPTVY